jgi:HEAT repeat protein
MWYPDFQNRVRRGVLALAVVLAVAAAVQAQEEESAKPPAAAEGAAAPSELEQLLPRLTGRDRELLERRIKTGKLPEETKDQRVIVLVDFAHLASPYYGSPTNKRFAAIRLASVNLTGRDVVLKRDDMRLTADGQEYSVSDPPQQFQNFAIQVDKQSHQLKTLGTPAETTVASGAAGRVWLLFPELPPGNHVPPMKLKIKAGDAERELDINALQRDLLGMKTERLGPRDCLGLVTLSGVLNSINVGSLVDELDRLTAEKVVRVVIHWADGASLADASLGAWMQNSANALGRQPVESQYPPLPVIIRELHLAGLPTNGGNGSGRTYYGNSNSVLPLGPRIHGTMPEAVVAALSSAYETVPLPELLAAIQSGRRLERAAAIVGGAARLSREQLPLLLKLADDEDDLIRQSALSALSQFGERAAIEKLAEHVRRNVEPNSSIAVASLAGSRYAAAHTALLELLKSEPPEVKKSIVRVLANFPRPIWSDVIYEFTRDGRSGLNVEALNALVQVGHPKLLSVLADALRGDDAELRQQAFSVLATRTDRESEELALEYTLEQLKTVQPTPQMLALLNRVKDPRALPLLMARFDGSSNKSALIQTLALIGDRGTARFLGEKFESLQNHERGEVLRAIARLDTGIFRRLAAQALLASDSSTVGAAVQGLQEDGGPDAVRIMIDALDRSTQSFTWSYVCNALAMIGTPPARMALLKAREGENADKRNFAVNALQSLRMRSPGYQYIYQGQNFARKEQWKEAIEQFDMAIQLDPQLPDAYSERGQALLRQDKFADAGKDFARAVELDPYNAFALTGLCTVLVVVEGKHAEAVARVEENRAKFPNNALFNYNAACVYGRALERVDKDEKLADREALRKKYREAAIADLKKAMELGFQDVNWMKNDPDLKSLHDAPAFQELLKSAPTAQRAAGRRLRLPAQAIRTAQE